MSIGEAVAKQLIEGKLQTPRLEIFGTEMGVGLWRLHWDMRMEG